MLVARLLLLLLFASTLASSAAHAQPSADDVRHRIQDKSFLLRGMYVEDKLKFDGSGTPDRPYKTGSFTVCGFRVDEVKISGDHLRLSGVRLAELFDGSGVPRMVSLTVDPLKGKEEPVTIEIDKHGRPDFNSALDAIFADSIAQLGPSLPSYWQHYIRSVASGAPAAPRRRPCRRAPLDSLPDDPNLDSADFPSPCFQRTGGPEDGSGTRPPHVVHTADPEFSESARRAKVSGNVLVSMLVEPDGTTSHIQIVRPLGFGLDEKAVQAVGAYQFEPALQNGQPVRTALYVEVNFQIF